MNLYGFLFFAVFLVGFHMKAMAKSKSPMFVTVCADRENDDENVELAIAIEMEFERDEHFLLKSCTSFGGAKNQRLGFSYEQLSNMMMSLGIDILIRIGVDREHGSQKKFLLCAYGNDGYPRVGLEKIVSNTLTKVIKLHFMTLLTSIHNWSQLNFANDPFVRRQSERDSAQLALAAGFLETDDWDLHPLSIEKTSDYPRSRGIQHFGKLLPGLRPCEYGILSW